MTAGAVYPELVAGRRDRDPVSAWLVKEGTTERGGASCDLSRRVLEVPLDVGETARVVRAHELLHARVSPHVEFLLGALDEVTPRALECAEEARVNALADRLGFDVGLLCDGSERAGGRSVGQRGDWSEAICFLVAVLGTGGEREFLAGLRKSRPEWSMGLRALKRHVARHLESLSLDDLADTAIVDGTPIGYARSTLVVARLLTRALSAAPPGDAESLRVFRRSLEPGARRAPSGRFASLSMASSELRRTPRRGPARSWRPSVTGTSLRYPGRLVTDHERRMFARHVRSAGGVVIVDQSGSMDLGRDDLAELLRVAPQALVVGYSHRPGDIQGLPNAWLLAQDGRISADLPPGNVGNGVDGPVLRWALAQAHHREIVVWITDGQITDSNDHPSLALTRECASLVRRHRVRLARDVDHAGELLRRGAPSSSRQWGRFGRLGRELLSDQELSIFQAFRTTP